MRATLSLVSSTPSYLVPSSFNEISSFVGSNRGALSDGYTQKSRLHRIYERSHDEVFLLFAESMGFTKS